MALTMDNSEFVRESHYVTFIDSYTTTRELGLDGRSCYRLRGGVVHRGNAAGHPFFGATHVIFTVPESGVSFHAFSLKVGESTAAMFDLGKFCDAMAQAVRKWYAAHKDDEKVKANVRNLLSLRPDGIIPFIAGAPIVASGPE